MKKVLTAGAAAVTLLATAAPASAHDYRYRDQWGRVHHHRDHNGATGAIVGGLIGAVIGSALTSHSYNSYPSYGYGYQNYGYSYPSYGYSSGYAYPSYGYSRGYSYPSYSYGYRNYSRRDYGYGYNNDYRHRGGHHDRRHWDRHDRDGDDD